jgi:2-polyprenyl-6-methoxyphenol hydroxylase-like FAD-dependent oxidoreductase
MWRFSSDAATSRCRSRAGGFQSRTVEVFDQRGVAERFLAEGQLHRVVRFGGSVLDISDLPTRHPYTVGIWQKQIERIMADWIAELGVRVSYACEVSGFEQDEEAVAVHLDDGQALRAQYLVGCDGGPSRIRRAAGIDFPGWDPTRSNLIAEVEMSEGPEEDVLRHDAAGVHAVHKMEDGRTFRVVVTEQEIGPSSEPTLQDLSEALITVFGTDYGVRRPTWISRFTDMTHQAAAYRDRRVLLAGDAAHIHYPAGGQGLSLGVQDAVNLGWKLAQVAKGISPDTLLDTYHAERHPVGARVLKHTMAQAALQRRDDRSQALVDEIAELVSMEEPRRHLTALVTGLDIHYELGDGHPLLGRRMPDLDLTTTGGPRRVYELLHVARPLVLNLGPSGSVDMAGWADQIQLVDARYQGNWELPVIGVVSAPSAVLVRPDGYVAWVGLGSQQGLADALTTWSGQPIAT